VASVPAGDAFSNTDRYEIDQAVKHAEQASGLHFSVYVGAVSSSATPASVGFHRPAEADSGLRPFSERLHAQLPDPAYTVLVVVNPAARLLEIVTGEEAKRTLSDEECRLAALAMTSAFSGGDLTGGIVAGVHQLGEHAYRPATLHADQE
jgi:hypothetical protein